MLKSILYILGAFAMVCDHKALVLSLLDHSLWNRRGQVSWFAEKNVSFETKVIRLCFSCTNQITNPPGFNSFICKKILWKFFLIYLLTSGIRKL